MHAVKLLRWAASNLAWGFVTTIAVVALSLVLKVPPYALPVVALASLVLSLAGLRLLQRLGWWGGEWSGPVTNSEQIEWTRPKVLVWRSLIAVIGLSLIIVMVIAVMYQRAREEIERLQGSSNTARQTSERETQEMRNKWAADKDDLNKARAEVSTIRQQMADATRDAADARRELATVRKQLVDRAERLRVAETLSVLYAEGSALLDCIHRRCPDDLKPALDGWWARCEKAIRNERALGPDYWSRFVNVDSMDSGKTPNVNVPAGLYHSLVRRLRRLDDFVRELRTGERLSRSGQLPEGHLLSLYEMLDRIGEKIGPPPPIEPKFKLIKVGV
jgi:hypothetical protein